MEIKIGVAATVMALICTACTPSGTDQPASDSQTASLSSAAAPPQPDPSVANLKPIELSTLVLDAMPPEGTTTLDRALLSNDPISWIGDDNIAVGGARIHVGGTIAASYATQPPKEAEWTVTIANSNDTTFHGLRVIDINPGPCSNDTDKNCTYTADQAFAAPGLHAVALCQVPRDNGSTDYYRLTAQGRAPMTAAFDHGQGSAGSETLLFLALETTAGAPCENFNGPSQQ
jgi:hypothetical protein